MSLPPNPIDDFLNNLKQILSHTWQETGYGHLEIDSERIKQDKNKIRVLLRGSTHYQYTFNDDDLEKCSWNKK